ncbi:hypothetical protein EDD69_1066 [Thermolongibacillus altinsuensis]|uniref:YhzD-like protein n=1 Tax=Thermolongibacillus altinsuensis TaxID=575256 RepID=A0A4R1QGB4_9BACL|nr:hypothetical protein [Thermolongibacillus altinsuensis]TCL49655.1 hypothetical protein EDD69_1066 [Thermolongibacillus altinsuensis]GMB09561.1 hypothetical protein B1no1_22710 [Thermolongibacillus altinsuensis]
MKQYIFKFSTQSEQPVIWEEFIPATGMMDAFRKAKALSEKYKKEKGVLIKVKYKGVRYYNADIA